MPAFYYNKAKPNKFLFWIDRKNGGKTDLLPLNITGYICGKMYLDYSVFSTYHMDMMAPAPLYMLLIVDPEIYDQAALNAIKVYFEDLANALPN